MWKRLQVRLQENGEARPFLFKVLRKTGATMVEALLNKAMAQIFLSPTANDVASENYLSSGVNVGVGKSQFERLAAVLKKLRKALQPMFDARTLALGTTEEKFALRKSLGINTPPRRKADTNADAEPELATV